MQQAIARMHKVTGAGTQASDVAGAAWWAATDPSSPLNFPAGAAAGAA
jgi:hypothetical protein